MPAKVRLEGSRVALLVADGFEQVERTEPRGALREAGAQTDRVAPRAGTVRSWNVRQWGERFAERRHARH
jgi:protease I